MVALLLSDEKLTETQRDAIFRWLDMEGNRGLWADALDRYCKAHPRQGYADMPDPALVARGWREVAERLGLDRGEALAKVAALRRPRWRRTAMRVAAVLLPAALVVGGWFARELWTGTEETDTRMAAHAAFVPTQRVGAHADSVRRITLADGTRVTLNKGATFAYNDDRECELHGEAWFKVAKDTVRPLVIHSEHVTAKVFGTELHFDTHGTDGSSRVALYNGSVELSHSAGTHRLEAPGQEFTLHHATRTHAVGDFDHSSKPDWVEAVEEFFDFMTFGEIFDLVEAAYGVTIAGRDKIDLTKELNFVLDYNLSIGDLMSMLEFSHGGFSHSIDGSDIHIRGR